MEGVWIRSDIASYSDSFGLVQPLGGSSGNGILYTAEAYILLAFSATLEEQDRERVVEAFAACELMPGLYQRHPSAFRGDQEGPDDYVGIAAASAVLDLDAAAEVLEYGRSKRWSVWWRLGLRYVYNNLNAMKFTRAAWLGRQPQLIALLQYGAGEKPALWRRFWLAFFTLLPSCFASKRTHDAWILSWLAFVTVANRCGMVRLVHRLWRKRFEQTWPGGLSELFSDYFLDPQHPIAKHAGGFEFV